MKRMLAIILLLLCGAVSSAQEVLVSRSTKSYLIADYSPKDDDFVKEKCRQAGMDLGLPVLANRIPTDSRLVGPKPSEHLLRQGVLQLQLPIDAQQTEFAVYHSDLFDRPATINVLQIDDELVTYRTTEVSGDIHLFYHCIRGAFGTKATAHDKNAVVYKLWDTPERTLLPDLELQDQMAQSVAKECAQTDYPVLIFNDLKSYGYNNQGDLAIGRFLDTMQKYNPDKLLQADLLTPISARYLSRINENQIWNETMRTKIVETLTEKQAFFNSHLMPWMIGNFQIRLADKYRKATTMEELEWLLSKAAAFDAGFGLDCSAETMRRHGLTDAFLNTIRIWEQLRLDNAFTVSQKEQFKDPYGNWHIEEYDSVYLLYPQHISRRYYCHFEDDGWEWNTPYGGRFSLCIAAEGKGSVSDLELHTENGTLSFSCDLKAGQYLIYGLDGSARITDMNFNTLQEVVPTGVAYLPEGLSAVSFRCEMHPEGKKTPEITVRFITRGEAESIVLP